MELHDVVKRLNALPTYYIEIGVVSGKTNRKQVVKAAITNAEILFINENGSPLRHIPARPVLQMTIDWANANLLQSTLDKCIDAYIQSNFSEDAIKKELNKMCIRMQNYARHLIYDNDGRLQENAPSTIRQKGFNHPLFQTGQLARSITCKLVDK